MTTPKKIKNIIEASTKLGVNHKSKVGRENRDLFISLCQKYTDASLIDLCILLDASYSTIKKGQENYNRMIKTDPNFKSKAERIEHIIWMDSEKLNELTPNFSYVQEQSIYTIDLSDLPEHVQENVMFRLNSIVKMESSKVMNYNQSVKIIN
jgi:hypothetical protein